MPTSPESTTPPGVNAKAVPPNPSPKQKAAKAKAKSAPKAKPNAKRPRDKKNGDDDIGKDHDTARSSTDAAPHAATQPSKKPKASPLPEEKAKSEPAADEGEDTKDAGDDEALRKKRAANKLYMRFYRSIHGPSLSILIP